MTLREFMVVCKRFYATTLLIQAVSRKILCPKTGIFSEMIAIPVPIYRMKPENK